MYDVDFGPQYAQRGVGVLIGMRPRVLRANRTGRNLRTIEAVSRDCVIDTTHKRRS